MQEKLFGIANNATIKMGSGENDNPTLETLQKETKLKDVLRTYLEVCYLDLNGPNNTGRIDDIEFRKEFSPFDPTGRNSFIASEIID